MSVDSPNIKDMSKNIQNTSIDSPVIFLGFCERVALVPDGFVNLSKWNVMGLKHIVPSFLFPMSLLGFNVGLAINPNDLQPDSKIRVTGDDGKEVGTINIATKKELGSTQTPTKEKNNVFIRALSHGWTPCFFQINDTQLVIQKPGTYYLSYVGAEKEQVIGEVYFAPVDLQPLSDERT